MNVGAYTVALWVTYTVVFRVYPAFLIFLKNEFAGGDTSRFVDYFEKINSACCIAAQDFEYVTWDFILPQQLPVKIKYPVKISVEVFTLNSDCCSILRRIRADMQYSRRIKSSAYSACRIVFYFDLHTRRNYKLQIIEIDCRVAVARLHANGIDL